MFTNVWNTQWRNGHSCRCCLPYFRIRGDRQLNHQPKKKQPVQTPLSIGLFLAIRSRVRDMTLSITLHNFTLGATTKESLINKWRMKSLNISQNPDCYIFVKVQMRKGKKLAKRYIYIYMGGIEYHITTNLAIVIVSLMSLYMWYTKEDSLWMKTWHGCILWCPVWHSGNIEWKQDIEGIAQFCMQCIEQVMVFLIS